MGLSERNPSGIYRNCLSLPHSRFLKNISNPPMLFITFLDFNIFLLIFAY